MPKMILYFKYYLHYAEIKDDTHYLHDDTSYLRDDTNCLQDDTNYLQDDTSYLQDDASYTFRTIQVAFRTIQVTFRTIQVTFRTIQVTFRTIQDAFRTIQVTFRAMKSSLFGIIVPWPHTKVSGTSLLVIFYNAMLVVDNWRYRSSYMNSIWWWNTFFCGGMARSTSCMTWWFVCQYPPLDRSHSQLEATHLYTRLIIAWTIAHTKYIAVLIVCLTVLGLGMSACMFWTMGATNCTTTSFL